MTEQKYKVQSTDPDNRRVASFRGTHSEAVRFATIFSALGLDIIIWDPDGVPVVPGEEKHATPQDPMFSAKAVVWNTPPPRRPVAVDHGVYVCDDGSRWEEMASEWPNSGTVWQEKKPIPETIRDLETPNDYTGGRIVQEDDSQ